MGVFASPSSRPCSSGGSLGSYTDGLHVSDEARLYRSAVRVTVHQQTGRHSFDSSQCLGLSSLGVVQSGKDFSDCVTYPG